MSFRKKKRPKLIDDFPISNSAFMYIHNRRNSTREPLYETLDRILEQHERLTGEKKELDEEKAGPEITILFICRQKNGHR